MAPSILRRSFPWPFDSWHFQQSLIVLRLMLRVWSKIGRNETVKLRHPRFPCRRSHSGVRAFPTQTSASETCDGQYKVGIKGSFVAAYYATLAGTGHTLHVYVWCWSGPVIVFFCPAFSFATIHMVECTGCVSRRVWIPRHVECGPWRCHVKVKLLKREGFEDCLEISMAHVLKNLGYFTGRAPTADEFQMHWSKMDIHSAGLRYADSWQLLTASDSSSYFFFSTPFSIFYRFSRFRSRSNFKERLGQMAQEDCTRGQFLDFWSHRVFRVFIVCFRVLSVLSWEIVEIRLGRHSEVLLLP